MHEDKRPDSKLPPLPEETGLREPSTVKGAANSGANPGLEPATGYPEVDEVVAWAARARVVAQEVVGFAFAAWPLLTREAQQVASQAPRVLALLRLWGKHGMLAMRRGSLEERGAALKQLQEHTAARVQAALGMREPLAPMSYQDVVSLLCACKAVLGDALDERDGTAVDDITYVHNTLTHLWQVVESLGDGTEKTLVRAVRAAAWTAAEDMREAAVRKIRSSPGMDDATRRACEDAIRSIPAVR